MSGRHRFWTRGRRRTAAVSAGVAVLIASMVWTVRRQTEARVVAQAIDALATVEVIERARFAAAMRRADSLQSRARLLEAAAEFRLRPASDEEISFIRDVPPANDRSAAVEVHESR